MSESSSHSSGSERRLAAIMFTDIVGYTALMARDEEAARRARTRHEEVVRPLVERYQGGWIERTGDETLSSFPSALDAVNCALAVQAELDGDTDLRLRIGIHQGDVTFDPDGVSGDGVNVAARVRPLAEPGGISITGDVHHSVRGRPDLVFEALGEQEFKNVDHPVPVFAVSGTAEPPRPASKAPQEPRSKAFPLAGWAAAVVIAVALGTGWLLYRLSPDLAPIRSIAVLPLENLSGDPEQEYFADGMTEAVISEFAQIGSLNVISRTSVMQYKGGDRALPEIAQELNVEGIIEGSVLRAGERVRVTLQLIDARNDHHLWAESYERDLRDVLALQGEIARSVASAVAVQLTPQEEALLRTARPVDPEAHDAYLRGTLYLATFTASEVLESVDYFEQAVERDPTHVQAWTGIADAYVILGWGLAAVAPRAAASRARAAVERALALDDSFGHAHATLGMILANYEWRPSEAGKSLARALELSPSGSMVNNYYGIYLLTLGRAHEAVQFFERAIIASPAEPRLRQDKAWALYLARQFPRAIEGYQQVLAASPSLAVPHWILGFVYAELGRDVEAFTAWARFNELSGMEDQFSSGFEAAYRAEGLRGAASYWTTLGDRSPYGAVLLAVVSSYLGDADAMFHALEEAYREGSPDLPAALPQWPTYDPFRSDPRFQDLLRRINYTGAP